MRRLPETLQVSRPEAILAGVAHGCGLFGIYDGEFVLIGFGWWLMVMTEGGDAERHDVVLESKGLMKRGSLDGSDWCYLYVCSYVSLSVTLGVIISISCHGAYSTPMVMHTPYDPRAHRDDCVYLVRKYDRGC
jgi:hypothetical protein